MQPQVLAAIERFYAGERPATSRASRSSRSRKRTHSRSPERRYVRPAATAPAEMGVREDGRYVLPLPCPPSLQSRPAFELYLAIFISSVPSRIMDSAMSALAQLLQPLISRRPWTPLTPSAADDPTRTRTQLPSAKPSSMRTLERLPCGLALRARVSRSRIFSTMRWTSGRRAESSQIRTSPRLGECVDECLLECLRPRLFWGCVLRVRLHVTVVTK